MPELDTLQQLLNVFLFGVMFGVLYVIYYLVSLLAPNAGRDKNPIAKTFVMLWVFYIFVATAMLLVYKRVSVRGVSWISNLSTYIVLLCVINITMMLVCMVIEQKLSIEWVNDYLVLILIMSYTTSVFIAETILTKHKYLKH